MSKKNKGGKSKLKNAGIGGVSNGITGMGIAGVDKTATTSFSKVQLTSYQVDDLYEGSWMARKCVNIPVGDMLRNGLKFPKKKTQKKFTKEAKRVNFMSHLQMAVRNYYKHGCGVMLPIFEGDTEDNLDTPSPFTIGRNVVIKKIIVIPVEELSTKGNEDDDVLSDNYAGYEYYKYGQHSIHWTRLHFISDSGQYEPFNGGVITPIYNDIISAHAVLKNFDAIVYEATEDVLKVPGLYDSLADCNAEVQEAVKARLAIFKAAKGIHHMAVLDGEEDYVKNSLTLSGADSLINIYLEVVAAGATIPVTRFLGMQSKGLNNGGESDITIYHETIQARSELILPRAIQPMIDSLTGSANTEFCIASPEIKTEKQVVELKKLRIECYAAIGNLQLVDDETLLQMMLEDGFEFPEEVAQQIELYKLELKSSEDNNDDDEKVDDNVIPIKGKTANKKTKKKSQSRSKQKKSDRRAA